METNEIRDEMMMDLDLNQEPRDPPVESVIELGSLLNELETAHGQIEQRIRQLEAVTARARQRQRWRQARNPPETSGVSIEQMGNIGIESEVNNGEVSRSRSCKRNSSYLGAKALEMDMDVKKVSSDGGSFFDCNICFDIAKEPILTCCGHLFCWTCFYRLPYVDSTAKECPMCKGEVIDTNIIPIYGNGNKTHVSESESILKVPPRPRAHRIESLRQQRVNRGVSHVPVAEALRRIRAGIGIIGVRPQLQDLDGVSESLVGTNVSANRVPDPEVLPNAEAGGGLRLRSRHVPVAEALRRIRAGIGIIGVRPQLQDLDGVSENSVGTNVSANRVPNPEVLPNAEAGGGLRLRSRQFSRVLSESAASLSSISSALNEAERLVDNLESYIQDHLLHRSEAQLLPVNIEIDPTLPLPSSSRRTDVSSAFVPMENTSTNTSIEINVDVSRPSSSRRRSGVSRVSDVENAVSREARRRRLW